MDNKRIIYSTRENIKSTLVIFLKYKKSVLWVNFFVALLTLLTQFAATYLPGWIVDLLTGENAGLQVWTRVLPVVVLIGISELVIEVLNQKKADGSEKLKTGDMIRLYLAEETIEKFRKTPEKPAAGKQVKYPKLDIVYEDKKVIFLNKPAGVLSQKAKETDVSLTEALGAYLSEKNAGEETMFRAGLCNRLDRNTSGLILAGKTVAATQQLSELIAERAVGKYYLTVVKGTVTETERIRGYLTKNERTNRVSIQREQQGDAVYIETAYRPLCAGRGCTLLEVELVTGKSHQIRSHLAIEV